MPIILNYEEAEQEILEQINELRIADGKHGLVRGSYLAEKSRQHSEKMARENNLHHSKMNVYENIIWVPSSSAGEDICKNTMRTWLSSPGHKANLLRSGITACGIGIAETRKGDIFVTYMAE